MMLKLKAAQQQGLDVEAVAGVLRVGASAHQSSLSAEKGCRVAVQQTSLLFGSERNPPICLQPASWKWGAVFDRGAVQAGVWGHSIAVSPVSIGQQLNRSSPRHHATVCVGGELEQGDEVKMQKP